MRIKRSLGLTNAVIGVYFTKEEKKRIKKRAEALGATMSEYGREAILKQLFRDEIAAQDSQNEES